VAARFELHALELLACATFVLGTRGHAGVQLLHARGKQVANALELAEVEQHRTAGARADGRDGGGNEGEAFGDDRGTLALQPGDLRPQRPPGGALVDPPAVFDRRPRLRLDEVRGGEAGTASVDHSLA